MMRTHCLLLAIAASACGPSSGVGSDGGGDDDTPCADGQRQCSGLEWQVCHDGQFEPGTQCESACDDDFGCVACQPNTGTCNGETSHMCRPDGSGYVDVYCDPALGLACNVDTGLCEGVCAPQNLGESYIGCEYYAVVTGNAVGNNFAFSVAVSNTTGDVANITIDGGALTAPVTFAVQPNSVATQALPWIHELKLCTGPTSYDCLTPQGFGANVVDGAYHLRSTAPVTGYQFSPLEYTNTSGFSYSNDASLLLPTNAWRENYVAATWQRFDANAPDTWPGIMAITAAQDGTEVTITTTATTNPATNVPSFAPGVPQAITLNSGDVLEIAAFGTYGSPPPHNPTAPRLTST